MAVRGTRRGGGRFEGRPSRGTPAPRSDVHFPWPRAAAVALAVLLAFPSACGPEGDGQPERDDGSAWDRGGGMRGMMDRMMERPSPEDIRGMMAMMGNMPEGVATTELPEPDSRGAGVRCAITR